MPKRIYIGDDSPLGPRKLGGRTLWFCRVTFKTLSAADSYAQQYRKRTHKHARVIASKSKKNTVLYGVYVHA